MFFLFSFLLSFFFFAWLFVCFFYSKTYWTTYRTTIYATYNATNYTTNNGTKYTCSYHHWLWFDCYRGGIDRIYHVNNVMHFVLRNWKRQNSLLPQLLSMGKLPKPILLHTSRMLSDVLKNFTFPSSFVYTVTMLPGSILSISRVVNFCEY